MKKYSTKAFWRGFAEGLSLPAYGVIAFIKVYKIAFSTHDIRYVEMFLANGDAFIWKKKQ